MLKGFETSGAGGRVRGDLLDVDLGDRRVSVRLLRPPTVPEMADAQGAVAGVNGIGVFASDASS